jgi:hypothetical protein
MSAGTTSSTPPQTRLKNSLPRFISVGEFSIRIVAGIFKVSLKKMGMHATVHPHSINL